MYSQILSDVFLFLCDRRLACVCVSVCVRTPGSVPSLIHVDARWTVICSARQLLTAAAALWLARPRRLIDPPKNPAGRRDSAPTGSSNPAGSLAERALVQTAESESAGLVVNSSASSFVTKITSPGRHCGWKWDHYTTRVGSEMSVGCLGLGWLQTRATDPLICTAPRRDQSLSRGICGEGQPGWAHQRTLRRKWRLHLLRLGQNPTITVISQRSLMTSHSGHTNTDRPRVCLSATSSATFAKHGRKLKRHRVLGGVFEGYQTFISTI